jgi:hypothetical protein
MSRHLWAFDRHLLSISAGLLPATLALSACGGGGGTVASIPPPPPAPMPGPTVASIEVDTSWLNSPATHAGSYGLIALFSQSLGGSSSRFASPGEFGLQISHPNAKEGFTYTLDAPSGFLPAGLTNITLPVPTDSWIFNPGGPNYRYDNPYGDYEQFFGQNLKEYEVHSDGSKTLREDYDFSRASFENRIITLSNGQLVSESLLFDAGLSYVAMGEWAWGTVTVKADGTATPTGDTNSVRFVYGDRTPASGIPASGTATYDAHTLGQLPFALTADFGQRSISTEISQASIFDVSGSAPFSNDGSFDIPLTGTAGSQAASGTMDGAFFGPHAEQVGGVVGIERADGAVLMQDAFVGQQPPH